MKEKDDQIRVEKEKVEEAKTRQAEEEARHKDSMDNFLKEAQKDDDQFALKCPALGKTSHKKNVFFRALPQ